MIGYALAKELKDAGWDQPDISYARTLGAGGYIWPPVELRGEDWGVYVPSLSELIEACPRSLVEFPASEARHLDLFADDDNGWIAAYSQGNPVLPILHGRGHTPEEAVARLWLKMRDMETDNA